MLRRVAMCCAMLDVVGANLKRVKYLTFSSEEWPKGKLQTVWIWNPDKFRSFCAGLLKCTILGKFHRHLGWLSRISNFPRFHKNVNSLELWKYISENSSPKGSFWRNKRKSEFSELSWHSPYLQAMAIFCHCSFPTFFLSFSSPFSRFFYSCYLLHFTSFRAVAKSWVLTKYKAWQWDLDQL